MQSNQNEISAALKRTNLFYVIFGIVAPALYIILGYYVTGHQKGRPEINERPELIFFLLLLLSMAETIIALVIRWKIPRFFINWALKSKQGFKRPSGFPSFTSMVRGLTVIMFAFLEACTLYGLLIVFLGFEPGYIWLFVPFTVIGCIIVRPNEEFLRRLYEIYLERRALSQE